MAPHCVIEEARSVAVKMEDDDKNVPPKKEPDALLGDLLCKVCGDKALGYNFRAITCESCKAFFRRNALASKEFRCPFTEQCKITQITRRFCQKCRLEKCLSIGMNKNYIMSDEDKAQKRQKIAENRAKKRHTPKPRDDEVSSSKFVKREENDDSNSSQNSKQMSPSCYEENNIESLNGVPEHFDLNNQNVSVIKNNNLSDSHLENDLCDTSQFDFNAKKQDIYLTNYDVASAENNQLSSSFHPVYRHVSNGMSIHDDGRLIDDRDENHRDDTKDEENFMIRSMLTTSTPNGESSKLFTALAGGDQSSAPSCDNTQAGSQSSYSKADVARDILQDVERTPMEPNSIQSILCEAIKLEFEAYTSLSQINSSSRELNDAERAKLNELIVANKALLAPLDDHMTSFLSDDSKFKHSLGSNEPSLLGIINLTAVAIRRLIKMSKRINAFKNMCEEDQVALLKGGCTEMMILRSTMTYDCARATWKIPHSQEALSNIRADVLKLAKGNIYEEHDRFIRTFDHKWRTDENIILIMSAVVLFTPERTRVVHSDVIKLEQNSYYYLLKRYLESVYPGCEAKSTFLKLIQKIKELHKLADEVIGVYLDVNPSHVEPLLIEIFDLKQPH